MREDTGFSRTEEAGASEGWHPTPGLTLLPATGDTRPRDLETCSEDDPFGFDSDEGLASW
jgi:hypothetical protein